MRQLSKGKQGSTNTNRIRGRDSLQSSLVVNDLSVEQESPSLSLQFISAEEVRRALGEERARGATSSYSPQRAASRRQEAGDIHAHCPGQTAGSLAPLPDPWSLLTLQLASKKAIRRGPRPLCLQGTGPGAASEYPFLFRLACGAGCAADCPARFSRSPGTPPYPYPGSAPASGTHRLAGPVGSWQRHPWRLAMGHLL